MCDFFKEAINNEMRTFYKYNKKIKIIFGLVGWLVIHLAAVLEASKTVNKMWKKIFEIKNVDKMENRNDDCYCCGSKTIFQGFCEVILGHYLRSNPLEKIMFQQ